MSVAKAPSERARPRSPATILAAAVLSAATGQVVGVEPSFDCAKAEGAVEHLVCQDADLAALDRKLAEVYTTAVKQFEDNNYEDPRPVQRVWVKGRNDCWKAEDMRACVETSYKHRIAELRISYGDLVVPPTVTYGCGDFDLAAVFYRETDPPTAVLTPIGRHDGADQVIAYLTPTGSGAKYEAADATFWEHHGKARLTWFGQEMTCEVR